MSSSLTQANTSLFSFPYKLGYDVAGTILAVGTSVTTFHPGDEVYANLPSTYRGSVAEYTVSPTAATALKPVGLSFTEAASIPLVGLTALQSLQAADAQLDGGLKGKVVLIPGALSGTGSIAIQLAKNVFGAGRIITTLSTGKMTRAKAFLGEEGIEYVDYTKENLQQRIGEGQVDCMFDTMREATKNLRLMKKGGVIVSISMMPSGTILKNGSMPHIPWVFEMLFNMQHWAVKWWIGRAGVKYTYQLMSPDAHGLELLAGWVAEGKIRPLVGRTARLEDLQQVRAGCEEVYKGKGGVGKFVVEIS